MPETKTPPVDPAAAARAAGLRYVSDDQPGIRRKAVGKKAFDYFDASGKRIRDPQVLERVTKLVLPPAWRHVWICPSVDGHIQATGIDARGRKQYRYHDRWRVIRDQTKYTRMIEFANALPRIRLRVARDLALPGLPREKVLATVVRVMDRTGLRVGNEEYARDNKSHGLTTLRDKHVDIRGGNVHFEFRGKSGMQTALDLHDRRLARIIKQCQDIPGQELFQYIDDAGQRHAIGSADLNAYLKAISGADFTAKDFRTWVGTVYAAIALCGCEPAEKERQLKKNVTAAIKQAAEVLGNRPATCRKFYVHPTVVDSYMCGDLLDALRGTRLGTRAGGSAGRGADGSSNGNGRTHGADYGLSKVERSVLALLEKRERAKARSAKARSAKARSARR